MAKKYTHTEAVSLKKNAFKRLTNTLESFLARPAPVDSGDIDYTKKAALISKWISQYANYISFEEKFNPQKLIRYKRGDIIFANFGFNIGAEFGGEHYAVVIDKESKRNASTVTVIPLSSYKPEKSVHPNDLYLGNELYQKLFIKLKTRTQYLKEQAVNNYMIIKIIKDKISFLDDPDEENPELDSLIHKLSKQTDELEKEVKQTEKIQAELFTLKQGSVAKIQQITTISKIRIYNPKNSSDPLFGISFSEDIMKKINQKIKERFIFDE